MNKSIPFSVRLAPEDADFIASLQMEGANTPSDKIRAIIREARVSRASGCDYASALRDAREELRPVTQGVKSCELARKQHSELVGAFLDWVAEAHAFTVSAPCGNGTEGRGKELDLEQLEEGIADRCFRLLELIARMGVTSKAPCYNKDIINRNFEPLEELIHIIDTRIHK